MKILKIVTGEISEDFDKHEEQKNLFIMLHS